MTTEPEVLSPETVTVTPEPTPALSPEELKDLEIARLKDENAALKKDRAECVALAEEHAGKIRDYEDLKARAKSAKDEADVLADALSKRVRGEVQTEIDPEDEDQAEIEFTPGAAPTPDEAANLDAIAVEGLDWPAMEQHVLSALVSTGKPQRVKPVTIMGLDYVLVNVQARVGIFHQVMDAERFTEEHKTEGATRPDERSEALKLLGDYAGLPVKVGRKVMYLGARPLLVRMPPDAANVPVTADDTNPVGNRIVAHLKSSGVEQITVDALAKLLGVEWDVIELTSAKDDRLIWESDAGLVRLA